MAFRSDRENLYSAEPFATDGVFFAVFLAAVFVLALGSTIPAWGQGQTSQANHNLSNHQRNQHRAVAARDKSSGARAGGAVAQSAADVALLAQGAKLHKEGRIDEAEAIFRQVLAHDPCNVDAFYDLGAIAEGRGELIDALSNYHAALALRPGDRELKEAVSSTERAIRKGALTLKQDENEARKKFSPLGALPPAAAIPYADQQNEPIFSVPQADAPPRLLDAKTFQLSSRKGALVPPTLTVSADQSVPPTLGVTPDQFPDILPTGLSGITAATGPCPPNDPPTLTVGQSQASGGSHKMRQAASMLLTVGAGAALAGSELHCPICHMLRFHF